MVNILVQFHFSSMFMHFPFDAGSTGLIPVLPYVMILVYLAKRAFVCSEIAVTACSGV